MNNEMAAWARFATRIGLAVVVAAVGLVAGVIVGSLRLAGVL
jgi:predicted Co/Zn/Cd cation transporter (cation efflux family)